jgi:hypothetical protein
MTTGEPSQTEPDTLRRPVYFDRLSHVIRTRGIKAAGGREQRRDHAFVGNEESDETRAQRANRRRTSVCRSVNMQSSVLRRGLNTIDHSGFRESSSSRTASRIRRLIRLRTTAFPRARGVVNPTRGPATASRSARQKAAKKGLVYRDPLSYTLRKSDERSSRTHLGKPWMATSRS